MISKLDIAAHEIMNEFHYSTEILSDLIDENIAHSISHYKVDFKVFLQDEEGKDTEFGAILKDIPEGIRDLAFDYTLDKYEEEGYKIGMLDDGSMHFSWADIIVDIYNEKLELDKVELTEIDGSPLQDVSDAQIFDDLPFFEE